MVSRYTLASAAFVAALVAWVWLGGGTGCGSTNPPTGTCEEASEITASSSTTTYTINAPAWLNAYGVTWTLPGVVKWQGSSGFACIDGGIYDGALPEDAVYECPEHAGGTQHCPGGTCPNPCVSYHAGNKTHTTEWRRSAGGSVSNFHCKDTGDCIQNESAGEGHPRTYSGGWTERTRDDVFEFDYLAPVTAINGLSEAVGNHFITQDPSPGGPSAADITITVSDYVVQFAAAYSNYKGEQSHGCLLHFEQNNCPDPGNIEVVNNDIFGHKVISDACLWFPPIGSTVSGNNFYWYGTSSDWNTLLDAHADGDNCDGYTNRERMEHYIGTVCNGSCGPSQYPVGQGTGCSAVTPTCIAGAPNCGSNVLCLKPPAPSQATFLANYLNPLVNAWKAGNSADDQ